MNTLNGYSKSTLSDSFALTASGGHISLDNFTQKIEFTIEANKYAKITADWKVFTAFISVGSTLGSYTQHMSCWASYGGGTSLRTSIKHIINGTNIYIDESNTKPIIYIKGYSQQTKIHILCSLSSFTCEELSSLPTDVSVTNTNTNNYTLAVKSDIPTKTGDGSLILYAELNNEVNFGGTSTSSTIYFGNRAKDSKAVPSKFIFGSSTGTAELVAKTFTGNATSATKLSSTKIAFTPAETALTPDEVYALMGGTTIKRGSWSYTSNGYISNDTTGVGTIDLAGTTVIQADGGSSTAYTQLYLTPSTGTTDNCKTNEIFMYNNNGSNYTPSWTRVLTNRNYKEYALSLSGGTITGSLVIKRSPSAIQFNNSSGTTLGYLGINTDDDPAVWKADGKTLRHILHSGNYGNYALPLSGGTLNIGVSTEKFESITTSNDDTAWNVRPGLKIANNNNALVFWTSGTYNERTAYIQSGHKNQELATALGPLHLNPFGGKIIFGKSVEIVNGNVTATTFTGNLTGTADIAKTLPHFKISSNSTLPTDGSPEYVKFATITIPTTAWARKSVTLIFQDYETRGYQGDILTIQASSNGSGVGSIPQVKWVTKYQKSTIENIIISKISDNVYDLYLEATILPYVTLRIFYLTLDDVGQDKTFYFINNASSWSTTAPDPITTRSTLNNVASELGSAKTLWGQSFDGTTNVSGDMTGVGSVSMTKALTITGTDGSTANLHFGRASYNYISGPSGSTIHMCPGGITKDSIHGYVFSATEFYPGTTNAYSIGTSSKQWNNIYGKTLYENGTSLSTKYAAKDHTHTFLTDAGPQPTATTRNLTNFPSSKTLFTGYWVLLGGYATTYGTTLDISHSTWYLRLAFNTTGRIEYFRGINTNNTDNTEATLSKVGDLAYTSDIPTTFTWTAGKTEGPTGTLTGGMTDISFAAIPSASSIQSGVVTTGSLTFTGMKTFNTGVKIATDQAVYFSYLDTYGTSSNYVFAPNDDNLHINAYENMYFKIAGNAELALTASSLRPVTSGGLTLGTADYKFHNIHAASIGTSADRCTYGYFSNAVYATSGFYESSDERLKNILKPVKVNLDDLSKLRKVYYIWNNKQEDGNQLGMIALDVQKLYPELVDVDKETGYLSLAYDKLSVLALSAIDELYKRILDLQNMNKSLLTELNKLKTCLLKIKN